MNFLPLSAFCSFMWRRVLCIFETKLQLFRRLWVFSYHSADILLLKKFAFFLRGVFKGSKIRNFLGLMFMFPVSMVYFFIFDVFFMIQTIINDTISVLFSRSVVDAEMVVDSIFTKMGLTLMDSKGYRRLRTLSQLTFESIPQIVFLIFIDLFSELLWMSV